MVRQLWYDLQNNGQNESGIFHFHFYDKFVNGGGFGMFLLNCVVLVHLTSMHLLLNQPRKYILEYYQG